MKALQKSAFSPFLFGAETAGCLLLQRRQRSFRQVFGAETLFRRRNLGAEYQECRGVFSAVKSQQSD